MLKWILTQTYKLDSRGNARTWEYVLLSGIMALYIVWVLITGRLSDKGA